MPWWWYVMLAGFFLFVALLVVLICVRRRRAKLGGEANLVGISGWLLLPMLALFGTPLALAGGIILDVNALVKTPVLEYAFLAGAVLLEIALSVVLIAFDTVLLVFFFQKRRFAPRLYIAFMVSVLAFNLLTMAAVLLASQVEGLDLRKAMETGGEGMARSMLFSAIWIPYFCVSKRVKATFVR